MKTKKMVNTICGKMEKTAFWDALDGATTSSMARLIGLEFVINPSGGRFKINKGISRIFDKEFSSLFEMTSIVIPNSVMEIGEKAFTGCRNLTEITCLATTPPSLGWDAFQYVPKDIPLYVPAKSVDAYKQAEQWKDFPNIIGK
jgi:hypothetical protein